MISDVPGSANSHNDLVVRGKTLQERDERLRKVFLKIKETGLKLNKLSVKLEKS